MDYSIIIPTAFDKRPLLEKCLKSIVDYTFGAGVEIIVVANGCTDNTEEFVQFLSTCTGGPNVRLLSFPDAIGYPKAVNAGLAVAKGEFIVLLNNDTVLLEQAFDQWLDFMTAPFADPDVAVTGPMKEFAEYAGCDFILFFCAMIRKSVIDQIGGLDEIFSPGYSEDVDFCARAQKAGFRVVQVPDNESHEYYTASRRTGAFPLFHDGNQTFKDHPDADLIHRNAEIVRKRYGRQDIPEEVRQSVTLEKALAIDGAVQPEELRWLAEVAQHCPGVIIEVGSLFGRSTRALADNMPPGRVLFAIDTWQGSQAEPEMREHAARLDGDQDYSIFVRNLWDHIAEHRVIPLRMHGRHAAKLLRDAGIHAGLVFIDAGHTYKEVKEDIENFAPLMMDNGVLSGHDYFPEGQEPSWISLRKAVDEAFPGNLTVAHTIWSSKDRPIIAPNRITIAPNRITIASERPRVYDCFTFFNELELLEVRLIELDGVVDRFVIAEATQTHQGKPKPLFFKENIDRFKLWLHKISHVVVDFPVDLKPAVIGFGPNHPETMAWGREQYQRNALMWALNDLQSNDICIISDVDEIPRASAVALYRSDMGFCYLEMELYQYYLNFWGGKWPEARILPFDLLKHITPCGARYSQLSLQTPGNKIENGGWHFSYMGGPERVLAKLNAFAHTNLTGTSLNYISPKIEKGEDLFQRPDQPEMKKVTIDSTWPKYIFNNPHFFKGWIKD